MKKLDLHAIQSTLEVASFDLDFKAAMVHNRILHTFLEIIENKKSTED